MQSLVFLACFSSKGIEEEKPLGGGGVGSNRLDKGRVRQEEAVKKTRRPTGKLPFK